MITFLALVLIVASIVLYVSDFKTEHSDNESYYEGNISVIIPARNEENSINGILEDVMGQGFHQVIVVDDHSEDNTVSIARTFPVVVLELENASGKKSAIDAGLKKATGEYVLQFDADVRIGANYRSQLKRLLVSEPDMLILPIRIAENATWLGELQRLEQAALLGISLTSAAQWKPLLVNGANMLVKRSAFEEIEGFKGNENWASGDDQFVLTKMLAAGKRVVQSINPDLIADVEPVRNWNSFWSQRLRWAGKIRAMWSMKELAFGLVAILIPLIPFIVLGRLLTTFNISTACTSLILLVLWYSSILYLLRKVNVKLGTRTPIIKGVIASIFFSIYAPICAIVSIFVRPSWKGRRI